MRAPRFKGQYRWATTSRSTLAFRDRGALVGDPVPAHQRPTAAPTPPRGALDPGHVLSPHRPDTDDPAEIPYAT